MKYSKVNATYLAYMSNATEMSSYATLYQELRKREHFVVYFYLKMVDSCSIESIYIMSLIKEVHPGEVILTRILDQDEIFNLCEILGEHEDSITHHGMEFTGPFSIGEDRVTLAVFDDRLTGEEVVLTHIQSDTTLIHDYLKNLF